MKNTLLIIAAICCCATYARGQSIEQNITEAIEKHAPRTTPVIYDLDLTRECVDFIDTLRISIPLNQKGKIQVIDVDYLGNLPKELKNKINAIFRKFNKDSKIKSQELVVCVEVPIYNAYKFTQLGTNITGQKTYQSGAFTPLRPVKYKAIRNNHYVATFDSAVFELVKNADAGKKVKSSLVLSEF